MANRKGNPRSKIDSQAARVARMIFPDIKEAMENRYPYRKHAPAGWKRLDADRWRKEYPPIEIDHPVKGKRKVDIFLEVFRERDEADIPSVSGNYLTDKDRITFEFWNPPKRYRSRSDISYVREMMLEVIRHEMEHARQVHSGKHQEHALRALRGATSLEAKKFEMGHGSAREIAAYVTGIYASSKKTRTSFTYNLDAYIRSVLHRYRGVVPDGRLRKWVWDVEEYALKRYPSLDYDEEGRLSFIDKSHVPKRFTKKRKQQMAKRAMRERERQEPNPKRKAKKKAARKKTPPYQLLINRCRKLWDDYCERPSKKRLKEVLEHLEKMKASTSKKVKEERSACLRIANKEARRLGMK